MIRYDTIGNGAASYHHISADNVSDVVSCGPSEINRDLAYGGTIFGKNPDDMGARFAGGVKNLKAYGDLVRSGWTEGADMMRAELGKLDLPRAASVKRQRVWAEEGADFDVDRFKSGRPDYYRATVRRVTAGVSRHHRIYTHMGALAHVEPEAFFWRGAVTCLLADNLESAGRRVEIIGYSKSKRVYHEAGTDTTVTSTVIKRFDEPLDMARISATISHVAGFRRGVFALYYSAPWRTHDGLGTTDHTAPPMAEEGDIVVNGIMDQDSARAFLVSMAEKYGER